MLIAVATQRGSSPVEVRIVGVADDEGAEEGEAHSDVEPKDGPSPIAPEPKELIWGAGAFIVFAVLMRLVLYPRMKKGMDARYASIRTGHEDADATRQAARSPRCRSTKPSWQRCERRPRPASTPPARPSKPNARSASPRRTPASRSAGPRRVAQADAAREAARDQVEEAVAELGSRRRRTGDRETTGQLRGVGCRVGGDDGGGRTVRLVNVILLAAAEEPHRDENGQIVTHHWLFPEQAELIYGTAASLIIFYLLYRFAGPPARKALADRTARVQAELDASAAALPRPRPRPPRSGRPRATSKKSGSASSPPPMPRRRRC